MPIEIREFRDMDREWARLLLRENWASPMVVTRGKVHRADLLPGFVVLLDGELKGLITFDLSGDECEIVTLNSLEEGHGIGSMLVDEVRRAALRAGCARLWLVTTNDNLKAIRFYQRRGFELVAVHRRAVEASRRLKSGIPAEGIDGIPIRDEIELEMILREDST